MTALIAGCVSVDKSGGSLAEIRKGTAGSLTICRTSSVMRAIESPDIVVNEKVVSEISRASMATVSLDLGDAYQVRTDESLLLMRQAEVILEGVATTEADRYFMLVGKADTLGGVIPAAIQLSLEKGIYKNYTESDNWAFMEVSEASFGQLCKL